MAGDKGVPPAQLALAWMLHQSVVTAPIIGATKLQHLAAAVPASPVKPSPNEIPAPADTSLPPP